MKLYSRPLSPYSARVRVALHAKGLAFQHEVPEMGWSKDPAFLADVNPRGHVPVLELDDGTRLVESSAIVEYLDDVHPEPPLRAATPVQRAHERAVALLVEHDVLKPMMDVFIQVDRKADAAPAIEKMTTGLTHVERFLADATLVHAGAKRVTLVDAILLPVRHSLNSLVSFGNLPELLKPFPRIQAFESSAREVPALVRVWEEMDEGLRAFAAWRAKQGK